MIDGQKFFDQTSKHNLITYDSIQKIATGQGDNYTTGCLQDSSYFKYFYTIIVIDLSNQLALDAHRKAIQLILLGIYVEQQVPQCFVLLMKQKKLFGFFKRSIISFNIYKLTTE